MEESYLAGEVKAAMLTGHPAAAGVTMPHGHPAGVAAA